MATEKVQPCGAGTPKVLVYMIDAARADVLEAVNHPIWQKLKANRWQDGYNAAWSLTAAIEPYAETNSGPNHVTIATGMLLRNHHVAYNDTMWSFNNAATPTWIDRLGRKFPDMRTIYAFSWLPDLALMADHGRHDIVCGTDEYNNEALVALLKRSDSPSAVMVYDGMPDTMGHEYGFYPYGDEYFKAADDSLSRLGNLLDVIRTSPTFPEENWLIVICADHGGMGFRHGIRGGQASTVPLLYCSKTIKGGEIVGYPNIVDIAAQVLRHFGMDEEVAELDGQAELQVAPPNSERPTVEKLIYDLSVVNGRIVNTAPDGEKYAVTACDGLSFDAGGIDLGSGCLALDALKDFSGEAFTFALKIKGDFSKIEGEQVIFSNKDCTKATLPGFALTAEKGVYWPMTKGKNRISFHSGCHGAPTTYVVPKSDRMDLGDVLIGDGEETLVAVSIDKAGIITVFQHSYDTGRSYWLCNGASGINPWSQLPWNLGQDGTGKYKTPTVAKISGFRFWTRALTIDELLKL